MKKYIYIIIAIVLFSSCSLQKTTNETTKINNNGTKSGVIALSFNDFIDTGNVTCGENTIRYEDDSLTIDMGDTTITTVEKPIGELLFECEDNTVNFYQYADMPSSLVVESLMIKGDEITTDSCIREVDTNYQVINTTYTHNGKVISENTGDEKIETCEKIENKLFNGEGISENPQVGQPKNTLYTNNKLGFSINFPDSWAGVAEHYEEINAKTTVYINLPTNDPAFQKYNKGMASMMALTLMTEEEYNAIKSECKQNNAPCPGVQTPILTKDNGDMIFLTWAVQDAPNDWNKYFEQFGSIESGKHIKTLENATKYIQENTNEV